MGIFIVKLIDIDNNMDAAYKYILLIIINIIKPHLFSSAIRHLVSG